METRNINRGEIVQYIKEHFEREGYHVLKIFPHTNGYSVDIERKEKDGES